MILRSHFVNMGAQTMSLMFQRFLRNQRHLRALCERVLLPSLCLPVVQQTRGVVILKRRWPIPPGKLGTIRRPNRKRDTVYEVVENTTENSPKMLRVILVEDVQNIGLRGDLVELAKMESRRLLRNGKAMYASPDNIKEMEEEQKGREGEVRLSQLAHQTISQLESDPVIVEVHPEAKWEVIPKEQVIHGFKQSRGVHIPAHALQMPDEPITSLGTYTVNVTINGIKTIPVELIVKHKLRQEDIDRMNFEKFFE